MRVQMQVRKRFPQRERQPWPSKGKEQSDLDSAQITFINIGMSFYLERNMTQCTRVTNSQESG